MKKLQLKNPSSVLYSKNQRSEIAQSRDFDFLEALVSLSVFGNPDFSCKKDFLKELHFAGEGEYLDFHFLNLKNEKIFVDLDGLTIEGAKKFKFSREELVFIGVYSRDFELAHFVLSFFIAQKDTRPVFEILRMNPVFYGNLEEFEISSEEFDSNIKSLQFSYLIRSRIEKLTEIPLEAGDLFEGISSEVLLDLTDSYLPTILNLEITNFYTDKIKKLLEHEIDQLSDYLEVFEKAIIAKVLKK